MSRSGNIVASIAIILSASAVASAQSAAARADRKHCNLCGKKVCVLEVTKAKKDVTYLDVESKEICIPGIKLPWECKRRCGGVRKIYVLTEEKREQEVCEYDWSIKTICTSCCKKHSLNCGSHRAHVNRDERLPFEYYAAELEKSAAETSAVVVASADQAAVVLQNNEIDQPPSSSESAPAVSQRRHELLRSFLKAKQLLNPNALHAQASKQIDSGSSSRSK